MQQLNRIGVVGGSGLYEIEGLTSIEEVRVSTPFGEPSDAYILGELDGRPVAFLSRHGRGHRFNPSEVPYRANIHGFRSLGVSNVLSVSAVGSLREDMQPEHFVVPDQFVDRTRGRDATFFENGVVAHVTFADPVCPELSRVLVAATEQAGCTVHSGGTYVCIEGPQFSTRAESNLYRSWGMDIVGMTNLTEAKLAREAEIGYATLAMVCDYDCWHEGHEDVTVEIVIDVLIRSVANAKRIVRGAVAMIPPDAVSSCVDALRNSVLTSPECRPAETEQRLSLLLDKYRVAGGHADREAG